MKYLTFLNREFLDELLAGECALLGSFYNRTVDGYVFGVIPHIDDIVSQVALILSYMAERDSTVCIRVNTTEELPIYDAINVNNAATLFTLSPPEQSLAVIKEVTHKNIDRSYAPKDIVTFHELLQYHLGDILKLLDHNPAKVQVDWSVVSTVWNFMEKTGEVRADDFMQIKSAVSEVV